MRKPATGLQKIIREKKSTKFSPKNSHMRRIFAYIRKELEKQRKELQK
jgi:hypothetical protein